MSQYIGAVALVVREYDEAIAFFCGKVGFRLLEDRDEGHKRWVVLAPPGSTEAKLLLAQARGDDQLAAIGRQTGGRVFLFLHTDDFDRDYGAMTAAGVRFLETPRHESYGIVAVWEDLYGNKWDLLQPTQPSPGSEEQ